MIAFPRRLPFDRFADVNFDLARYESRNELLGGQTQVGEIGDPRWTASFTFSNLEKAETRQLLAWIDSLRGGMNTFFGYNPADPFPIAYPGGFAGLVIAGGSTPFAGEADVSAITPTTIAITGLPAFFVITVGDMVGLVESDLRGLYRAQETVIANGSGVATVTVEPPVLPVFSDYATVQFERPVCVMNIISGSVQAPRSVRPQPISFRAIQKLI